MRIDITKLKKLAEITLEAEVELVSLEGQFENPEDIKLVYEMYENNEWGWCCAKVTASYAGIEMSDYLGCCSYESEEAFKNDAYYEDMVETAIEMLRNELETFHEKIVAYLLVDKD